MNSQHGSPDFSATAGTHRHEAARTFGSGSRRFSRWAAHPAYQESLIRLPGMGVRFGDPYAGEAGEDGGRPEFGWERALDPLE